MNNTIKYLVNKNDNNLRIDIFLSDKIKFLTRSFIKKLIEAKQLKINNKIITSASTKVKTSDKIIINIINKFEEKLVPKKINLDIVYEDKDILLINKPKGMVVHPGAGNFENTLANALAYKYKNNLSDVNGKLRPGIVHRIDKNTSGLLVVAKNNLAHSNLGNQFNKHSIKRKYQCLIWGVIRPLKWKIETLITRNKKNRQLMSTSEIFGKKAITNYKTIKIYNFKDIPKISLVECELETGRTHQIRVHLKHMGSSILGDRQYGKKSQKFKKINKSFLDKLNSLEGQLLHAQTLEFNHPTKNERVAYKSNLPKDFKNVLDFLEKLST